MGRAGRRWAGRRRAAGAQVQEDAQGAAGARGRRARWARNKDAVRAAMRGLSVLLGRGLCTRCTQPILTRFDSVLFLSQFLDIFRERGS